MSKYRVGRDLIILQQTKKRRPAVMAIARSRTWFDRIFDALFDLRVCAVETVRPIHKNHGGW